jgi:threonine/homoserine/homoserine lactone efflux protein
MNVIPAERLVAFVVTSLALIVVPGPSVLFVISRGIALGRRAALATVIGNSAGVYVQVVGVAVGVGLILERSILVFTVVKLAGAAYIVVLGVRSVRNRRDLAGLVEGPVAPRSRRRILGEGFVVGLTNPKATVFFAAVLPQFADPAAGPLPAQLLVLGAVFIALATVCDSSWGLAAGTARAWLARSPRRAAAVGGLGGLVTIVLGVRLAFTGRRH